MNIYKVYTKEKGLIDTNDYNDFVGLTLHRLDGPAYIEYDMNGNIIRTEYWIKDIEYTKDQYEKELLKLKVQSL